MLLVGEPSYPHNGNRTFGTARGVVLLIVFLAVDLPVELHKSSVDELTVALAAREVLGTPALVERYDEWPSKYTVQSAT